MKCPWCGGAIFENYEELRTVSVIGITDLGTPLRGDDSSICETITRSYNCADCCVFWDSWDDLRADLDLHAALSVPAEG